MRRALLQGFTLVELIIVMIMLSVLGIMTSSYISTGVDLYSDIAERDKSLNSIRFVMERLRREVANALPNSASVTDGCLTFTPIVASSIYSDFPISPVYGASGTISPISDYSFTSGDQAVVYLLAAEELTGSEKVLAISSINSDTDTLIFSGSISFPQGSPAKRVYIIRDRVSYCFSESNLYRSENSGSGVLMAENISGSFTTSEATLQRNALVQASFLLDFDGQEVPVEQTLHINNTP
jgi:MSHA biogenesis protein MshO